MYNWRFGDSKLNSSMAGRCWPIRAIVWKIAANAIDLFRGFASHQYCHHQYNGIAHIRPCCQQTATIFIALVAIFKRSSSGPPIPTPIWLLLLPTATETATATIALLCRLGKLCLFTEIADRSVAKAEEKEAAAAAIRWPNWPNDGNHYEQDKDSDKEHDNHDDDNDDSDEDDGQLQKSHHG